MAFQLNGKLISIDRPYTDANGKKYPHLRDASIREALGVIEVSDAPTYDQRFYWGVDNPKLLNDREESDRDGNPLYVKVWDVETESMIDTEERLVTKGLKSQWTAQVKDTANKLLAPTDWYVIRKAESDTAIPDNVVTYRAAVKTECTRLETAISGAADVEAFIAVVTAQNWPSLK